MVEKDLVAAQKWESNLVKILLSRKYRYKRATRKSRTTLQTKIPILSSTPLSKIYDQANSIFDLSELSLQNEELMKESII